MQPCDELRDLVLGNYEKEGAGKVLEVVKNTYSHQEGAIVVGTDPNEWFEGYDAILHFYEPFGSSRLEIKVKILKAYPEGSVGWTVDQVMVRLPNGAKLPMRHARVFHREDGVWKCVLNNISIAVPNEGVGA